MSPLHGLYGLTREQEEQKERILRDIRSPFERLISVLLSREAYVASLLLDTALLYVSPSLWPVALLLGCVLFGMRAAKKRSLPLPMRMPASYKGTDFNSPGVHGFKRASGMFYLGNSQSNNEELWISRDDILTHMLVLGTTGAGKTETLVSLCFNYFACASGFIYVDPKAAPKLGAQIWTMARMLGREDDFLLINYMADKKAQESLVKHHHARIPLRQSNTQNPFAFGDANQLTQLLFALMPADEKSDSIFSTNAQTLISGLMFMLVERRNKGIEPLSIETIRSYLMDMPKIDALAREQGYTETATLALQAGLATVGWDKSKDLAHQSKVFPEQYAYARAYFGRALSLLIDNYGRIFRVSHGEVDAIDVITNRRIFVTLIPSMDKDPKELKNLGQICLASVRNACAVGLGSSIQGNLGEVLGALPTEAKTPFGIIVDEYAAIETKGFEILLTQGRGLGMAVIVASQDFAGIKRASEAAAEQIVANCKTKLFMATEDPRETANLVQKLAGRAYVFKTSGYSQRKELNSQAYFDNLAVSSDMVERVDFRDLQRQIEGEVTISFKGEIIRGRVFHADPPLSHTQSLRLNCHIMCASPDPLALKARFGAFEEIMRAWIERARREVEGSEETEREEENLLFQEDAILSDLGDFLRRSQESGFHGSDCAIAALGFLGSESLGRFAEEGSAIREGVLEDFELDGFEEGGEIKGEEEGKREDDGKEGEKTQEIEENEAEESVYAGEEADVENAWRAVDALEAEEAGRMDDGENDERDEKKMENEETGKLVERQAESLLQSIRKEIKKKTQ